MGKRTDKFMADITAKLAEMRSAKLRAAELGKNLTEAKMSRDKAATNVANYYKKMGWEGQKAKREAEMDTDASYQKMVKIWEAELNKVAKMSKEITLKIGVAATAKDAAVTLVQNFSKFIAEKDKAKVLKWQKTSIQAAAKFIVDAQKTLKAA